MNITNITAKDSQVPLTANVPNKTKLRPKIKIDASVIFAQLESKTVLDVRTIDAISRISYLELIQEKTANNLPYILALVQDKKSSHFHYCDALELHRWCENNSSNPLTNQKISKIFYFTLSNYSNTKKDCFHYLGSSKDTEEKKEFLNNFLDAHQGNREAQCNLANCYYEGLGTAKDVEKAFYWYNKSANQGFAQAQHNLGVCYTRSLGVSKDLEKAAVFYTQAANQGYALAQYNVGVCYTQGHGVSIDMEKAVTWYTRAAKQNLADAQHSLACCFEHGEGVKQDCKKAFYWYMKAAKQNNYRAQVCVGHYYMRGISISQNFEMAVRWLKISVDMGHQNAHFQIAICYASPKNPAQDWNQATEHILLCNNLFNKVDKEELLEIYDFFQIEEKEMPTLFKETINTLLKKT